MPHFTQKQKATSCKEFSDMLRTLSVIFLLRKSDIAPLCFAVILYSPCNFQRAKRISLPKAISRTCAYHSHTFARQMWANITEKSRLFFTICFFLVGVTRFERATSWSRTKHSTKLSHTPKQYEIALFCFIAYLLYNSKNLLSIPF